MAADSRQVGRWPSEWPRPRERGRCRPGRRNAWSYTDGTMMRLDANPSSRRVRPLVTAACTAALVALPGGLAGDRAVAAPIPEAMQRGQEFWLALARECSIPPGESAAGLVNEAAGLLGSTDPVWRDDIGYGIVAACVYQGQRLSHAERRALVSRLVGNLREGIGRVGDDSVLLRSFSALDLSVLAALELRDAALDDAGYRGLLDAALDYLRDEQDLRGLEAGVGWIHATAHTADLLKFLARDARLGRADQARLLDAVWARMATAGVPVFTHAEDERLAAVIVSLVRREDFDVAQLAPWLDRFVAVERRTWATTPPAADVLAASQNTRNLLQSLYVALSMPTPEPTAGQRGAIGPVLETLQKVRR